MLKITKNQGSIQVTADKSGFYPFDGTITFPTNSLFTATSANTDMITFKSTSNGDVQFVGNYKDITISGRSYDTKQKFLTAFSNLANQGSVDAYTKAETDAKIDAKQGKLKAGNGITLTEDATDNTTVVKTAVSLTDNGNGAYTVGDSIEIDPYNTVRIGGSTTSGSGTRGSVVMGSSASITGICNVAIGYGAAGNNSSVAVGYDATTIGENSTAIGYEAKAKHNRAIAVGTGSVSGGENSIAIGYDAQNSGSNCVSIGFSSRTGENDSGSVVIGGYANGNSGTTSTLIGFGANSSGLACTGIGPTATVNETTPLAITAGHKTVNDEMQVLTMIQGDANGKISLLKGDGTDTRMVIQDEIEALKNAGGSGGTVDAYTKAETDAKLDAKQDKLTAGSGITITKDETAGTSTIATAVSLTDNGNGAYQVGDSIGIGGRLSVRIGNNTSALQGQNSIVIGNHAVVNNKNSIAIGDNAITNNENCIAIGNNTNTTYYTTNCVVIGNHAQSANSYSTVIGASARSNAGNAVAVGSNVYIDSNSSHAVAVGNNTKARGENSVAIGYSSEATKDNPLVIKAGYKTVDGNNQPLTVLQSDANGKLSILKGDGTDERIVIQDALSAGGSGGTVDAYTKTETDALLNAKQNTLTAGTGITIDENNVISSTGGSGGSANQYVNVKGTSGNATITDSVTDAVAIGSGASVTGDYGVSVGYKCASVVNSLAVGKEAYALGYSDVAIGNGANTKSSSDSSIAIGYSASANGSGLVAIGQYAEANDTTPLVINAGYGTDDDGFQQVLTVLQSDSNGKISIPLGDGTASTMCLQDEIAALKAEIAALKGGASTGA